MKKYSIIDIRKNVPSVGTRAISASLILISTLSDCLRQYAKDNMNSGNFYVIHIKSLVEEFVRIWSILKCVSLKF